MNNENVFSLHPLLYEIIFFLSTLFVDFFLVLKGEHYVIKRQDKIIGGRTKYQPPSVGSRLGFGNSTIVKWDKSTPNADKLNAVAKYFGVSMDYLMNGIDADGLTEKDNKDIAKDLNRIMEKLSAGEDGPASYDGEELDPEAAELFRDELDIALRRLKIINKEKYGRKKK